MFDRLDYLKRHFSTVLPHLTATKLFNLGLNAIELRLRIASPRSLPPYMKIEPTPLCHLRCVSCYQRDLSFKKALLQENNGNMYLSLDDLKAIVGPVKGALVGVSLSHYGEPLLNPHVSSLIEYLHGNNIAVSFPTNLSFRFDDDQVDRLVRSGLDCLEVSLDGTTEATYSQYRVGGDFHLVLGNVRLLADRKRVLGIRRPKLIWKFIEFEHNRHEVPLIGQLWRSLGFDGYEVHGDYMSRSSKQLRGESVRRIVDAQRVCFWPWNTMIVRWDGSVRPCCSIEEGIDLGNAIRSDVRDLWRSERYRSLRAGFDKKAYGQKMALVCKICLGLEDRLT